MTLLLILLWVQGSYTMATALWPIAHIRSFEAVTGPKTDNWLVKTVGALLLPVAVCWLWNAYNQTVSAEAALLGIGTAIGLGFVDFYYASIGRISKIYMADGVVQIVFIVCWITGWWPAGGNL